MNGYPYGHMVTKSYLSDIWILNSTSLQWFWMNGEQTSTTIGSYGTKNVTSSTNLPPRREYSAAAYSPRAGAMIMYSGYGGTLLSDLWYISVSLKYSVMSTTTTVTTSPSLQMSTTLAVSTFLQITTLSTTTSSSKTILSQVLAIPATSYLSSGTLQSTSKSPAIAVTSTTSVDSPVSYSTTTLGALLTGSMTVAAQTPSQTALSHDSQSQPGAMNVLKQFFLFIIIGVGTLMVLTCIVCIACRCQKRTHYHRQRKSSFTQSQTTTMTSSSVSSSMGTTMAAGQTEYAVPGFLQFKAGAEFRWHTSIAKGGGGEVFIGDGLIPRLQEFGSNIIVKVIGPTRESLPIRTAQAFDQELSLMHYLGRQKNIAGLMGWCEKPVSMLMKYYKLGSLENYIDAGNVFNKTLKLYFMLDVGRGLLFMHSKNVAHCDIKPANVLVDKDRNGRLFCALTDFGISQMYTETAQLVHAFTVVNLRGASIVYAAPEVVQRFRGRRECTKELAFAGDIYSAGMVQFALLNVVEGW